MVDSQERGSNVWADGRGSLSASLAAESNSLSHPWRSVGPKFASNMNTKACHSYAVRKFSKYMAECMATEGKPISI